MEEEKKKAYSEVVEVLKLIENEEKIEKIPFEVIQLIKANSDPMYKPVISKDIPLEDQNLRNETYSILGWIASKYWNENIGVELPKDTIEKETIEEEKIEEQNDIEDNKNTEIEEDIKDTENTEINISAYNDIEPECLERSNLPILASDIPWYQRLKLQVIRILKKIFKINLDKKKEGANE